MLPGISLFTRGNLPEVIPITKTIEKTLQRILTCFESGDIPEIVAYSCFPVANIPSANWSLVNRMLMLLAGTADARGFRQWKAVNRHVRKGAKAFHILVPKIITLENEEGENDEVLTGFLARPVFRLEDTEGAPLDYQKIELPELPLIEKAREWGISVKAIPGNYRCYGYYSQNRMEIALTTKDESVFFHELAHAAHGKVIGDLKETQCWRKEVVAELAAAAMCKLVGKTSKYLGNNYSYIKHYAEKAKLNPRRACLKVMGDVEKVLGLILREEKTVTKPH
jgi:antirestriction protein ArdC